MRRSIYLPLSVLVSACLALTVLRAKTAQAQGPPDTVWMRGSHFGNMSGIHFTPDGHLMVTTSFCPGNIYSPDIKIHHLPDGVMIKSFRPFTLSNIHGGLFGSALSPAGDILAALGEDADGSRHLRAWKIPSGVLFWDTTVLMDSVATESTDTLAFSPDGKYVYAWATSWNPGSGVRAPVSKYDATNGTQLAWALGTYNDNGNIVSYSYGDNFTVSANQILIGPPDPSAEMMTSSIGIDADNSGQTSGAWTGDGSISPFGYANWGVYEGIAAAYSPDGTQIAAMGFYTNSNTAPPNLYGTGWMAIWPTHSGSPLQILNYLGNNLGASGYALRWYNQIRWPVSDAFFAAGQNSLDQGNTPQSYVDRYDVSTGQVTNLWAQSVVNPPFMEVSPDGSLVGVAAMDGRDEQSLFFHVLDGTTGAPLQYTDSQGTLRTAFDFHGNSAVSTAWSADGTKIATSSMEGTVKVWRASDGALLCSMVHPGTAASDVGPIRSLSFSPDGSHLVATYQPQYSILKPVQILDWDISNPDAPTLAWSVPYAVQPMHAGNLWPVAYSPDGTRIAAIEGDPTNKYVIRMRNPADGSILYQSASFPDEYGAVLAFSPDSKSLAIYAANWPPVITIYRASDLAVLRSTGQIASVSALSWSPDSKKLAYGVANNGFGGVVVLDAGTLNTLWSQQTSPTCPLINVDALAIDPCGEYLVTESEYGSPDGPTCVFFYRMSDGTLMKRYDQEVGTGSGSYANVGAVQSFSFSPDGQFYAYARWDNGVVVAKHPLWTPPKLASLSCSSPVYGGNPLTATVTLDCPAPIGNAVVSLKSSNPALASVPAGVTIPVGIKSAIFPISTAPVAASTSVTLTATYTTTYNGKTTTSAKNKIVTINPPALSALKLSKTSIKGGATVSGTITLTGPTAVDTLVSLSSANPAATPVDSNGNPITGVTIPAGASKVIFSIQTTSVTANTTGAISATLGTVSKSVTLTVTP